MTSTVNPPLAIISAIGSRGDVHPMLAIASGLKDRGWRILFLTSEPYIPLAEAAGIESHSLVSAERFDQLIHTPGLWDPIRGMRIMLGDAARELIEPTFKVLDDHVLPTQTILVSHPLDFASRIYRDLHPEVPLVGALLAPVAVRTPREPARLTSLPTEIRRPAWLVEWTYGLADVLLISRWLGRPINQFRRTVGLPPVRRVLSKWYLSPDLILGLFPDWFAPSKDLLPKHMVLTGFPLADDGNDTSGEDAAQVAEILARHADPPIVFAPGSANTQAAEYFSIACNVCERLGKHGLLLTEHPEQLPGPLPSNVYHESYVPFGTLLPHTRVLVHHGGIGTTSQALATGTPQLVVPMAFDQFDNAERVRQLGCGDVLVHRKLTDARLAAALTSLMNKPKVAGTCRRIASKFTSASPIDAAVAAIEQLALQRRIGCDRVAGS